MSNLSIQVSIIIVNYRTKTELTNCIKSIYATKPSTSYEIIVVDNEPDKKLEGILKKQFSSVLYIKSPSNVGYGEANNIGALRAQGKFLFFLNPDTICEKNCLDKLYLFLEKKEKNVVAVAPLLHTMDGVAYQQGSRILGFLEGIFVLSFLNKLFPYNPISKKYLLAEWNKENVIEVDVLAGTAFMIRKEVFNEVGGFDKSFFLFFEEFDFFRRIRKKNFRVFIHPAAKLRHIWGASTARSDIDVKKIFEKSRFYYFKKFYGFFPSLFIELICRIDKTYSLLSVLFLLGVFIRIYRLPELMPFIGDQAWFYFSSRDLILKNTIPLLGIPSSHPWLHQGPLWTYLLTPFLFLFNFHPVSGAYFSALFDAGSIILIYWVGNLFYSRKVGLTAAALYATSPLIITNARFAYHTSPIPFFTLFFLLFLIKWIRGQTVYFPLILFTLTILYNFELATVSLFFSTFFLLALGYIKKEKWLYALLKKKLIVFSLIGFFLPLTPILVYDLGHNFSQTGGFMIWILYKTFSTFVNVFNHSSPPFQISIFSQFFISHIQELYFLPNVYISLLLFTLSFFYVLYLSIKSYKKRLSSSFFILLVFIPAVGGLLISQTPSEAYLPLLFPLLIISLAVFFVRLGRLAIFLTIVTASFNGLFLIANDYNFHKKTEFVDFTDRVSAAKKIVNYSSGEKYNLIGTDWLSEHQNYILNYSYLAWWLGNEPSKDNQSLKILVTETDRQIGVKRYNGK